MSPADRQPGWADDPRLEGLDVYRVGGAIRDELLGLEADEHDFVVVGASPEAMAARGFRPVGRDFPVFLHPDTHAEFALARTERKSAPGYRGFQFHTGPEVTLSDDLKRRDLTVNAIAEDRQGRLIDPFDGRRDLQARVLRHVSPAFSEDPVRLIRLARFATRFADFAIAPDTLALCRELVETGEVDHLVPERLWQEMARALMHDKPSRFFEVLRETGALARTLPEIDALWGVPQVSRFHPEVDTGVHVMLVIDQAAAMGAPLDVRYACLVHDLGKALTPAEHLPHHHGHDQRGIEPVRTVCKRLKVPNECRDLALLVCEHHLVCHRALELRPKTVVKLLRQVDAFRKPERFEHFLLACQADKLGRAGLVLREYAAGQWLRQAFQTASTVSIQPLLERGLSGQQLGQALHQARVEAVAALYQSN
ncbi:MAG: multifunctional CCA addition/repair protein [Wenzhouxiangellaceae bacterium]|nr:multifunctional CCA addition/repair protein [Wenzhouxiangellaceae bacterium]